MPAPDVLRLSASVSIPIDELEIRFIRSAGPGGQHVNKTSSQAEVVLDLRNSPSLSEADREWLLTRLAGKLDSAGRIRVTSQAQRSQLQNKTAAIEKLESLLSEAIKRPKKRKKTKPSRASVERRLSTKKRESDKKKARSERF
jgi:ribosome-associated protein